MLQTVAPPKYTLPALQRQLKNTPYSSFIKAYPADVNTLRQVVHKEQEIFNQVGELGMLQGS